MIHNHDEAGSLPAAATTPTHIIRDTCYIIIADDVSIFVANDLYFNSANVYNIPTELLKEYYSNLTEFSKIQLKLEQYLVGVKG